MRTDRVIGNPISYPETTWDSALDSFKSKILIFLTGGKGPTRHAQFLMFGPMAQIFNRFLIAVTYFNGQLHSILHSAFSFKLWLISVTLFFLCCCSRLTFQKHPEEVFLETVSAGEPLALSPQNRLTVTETSPVARLQIGPQRLTNSESTMGEMRSSTTPWRERRGKASYTIY